MKLQQFDFRKKNRKRKNEDEEDEGWKYEKRARTQFAGDEHQNVKMLLPIKEKGKVIPQMVVEEEEEEEENMEMEAEVQDKGMSY
jgi:hypothetical protein